MTVSINNILVDNESHDLIPFTWIRDDGYTVDGTEIPFYVNTSNAGSIDYTALVQDNKSIVSADPTFSDVYVPDDIRGKAIHDADVDVEIIAKDEHGISQFRVSSETNMYEWEDIKTSYVVPQFTWINGEFSNASTTTTTTTVGFLNGLFVGSDDGYLRKIRFNEELAYQVHEEELDNSINHLTFSFDSNDIYVSTETSYYIYQTFFSEQEDTLSQSLQVDNENKGFISLDDGEYVWAVEAYTDKVKVLDRENLSEIKSYEGFDSPSKVVYSEFHEAHFVVGTNVVWKIKDDSVSRVFAISYYSVADVAFSETGEICILLNGVENGIIRVLENDLYSFKLDQEVDETLRYCEFCSDGLFYIYSEEYLNQLVEGSSHYIYNIENNELFVELAVNSVVTTTTTTQPPATTQAVEVEYPNGGEELEVGQTHDIRWASSKGATELVRIELFSGGYLLQVLEESTVNVGAYAWQIPSNFSVGSSYQIKITWIAPSDSEENSDISESNFSIVTTATTTTTTTTFIRTLNSAVSLDCDPVNNLGVTMLDSGYFTIFNLENNAFTGLIASEITDVTSAVISKDYIRQEYVQSKIRVFVGTEMYLSNKWDSGEIETSLTSIYFGGGNVLNPGEKYYAHMQVYSNSYGWSPLQIQEFIMPR